MCRFGGTVVGTDRDREVLEERIGNKEEVDCKAYQGVLQDSVRGCVLNGKSRRDCAPHIHVKGFRSLCEYVVGNAFSGQVGEVTKLCS